jgi:hypothetical protein
MTTPKYRIGLSNTLTIIACLLTVGIAYGQAQTRIDDLERRVEEYENAVLPLLYEVKEDVQGIRVQQAKIVTDIEWMKNNSVTTEK